MKNILVFNVNWLGDVIFSSPVFKALKQKYPDAKISCLALDRVKPVLELIPYVDEIIIFDEKQVRWNVFAKYAFVNNICRRDFDAVFLLHGSKSRAKLMKQAGIPIRVGYDGNGRGSCLTHIVPENDMISHRSDFYLEVVNFFDVFVEDKTNVLTVPIDAIDQVKGLLSASDISDEDFLVAVNTGGNWDLKQWPEENFRLLVKTLAKDLKVKVVLSGAVKDVDRVDRIVSSLDVDPIVLAGKTGFRQLVALMQRADVVVSSDSGPLHVANAVGTSVVGIFGPTRPEITGPRGSGEKIILQYDLGCNDHACYELDCPDNICVKAVNVEDVVDAIRRFKS